MSMTTKPSQAKSLEEGAREYVLGHAQFAKELVSLAKEIRKIAAKAPNEATIATNFELKLYGQMKHRLQVEFEPVKEQSIDTKRHIKKGRLDSRIGALVIEYKQKSQLDTPKVQAKAVSQIKNYLEHLPSDFKRGAVGVLTDGWRIKFISYDDGDSFTETAFEDLSGAHLLRIIRGVLSLEKKALTPNNLIAGFCEGNTSPAKQLALALYDALNTHPTGRSNMLFREWQATRVKGVDLNPLAALTSRINYFINLSHLIGEEDVFDVPVYLGDSSYVPKPKKIGKVQCLEYVINTEKGPLNLLLPKSAVADVAQFSNTMSRLETHIENENEAAVAKELRSIIPASDLTAEVKQEITRLAKNLVDLQRNKWNGIWARIISNFLTTANLGRFDVIVGNPPWIDWKNLPQGYRERIKQLCIDRRLFSGDGITGGINLNVCALIANVAAQNWLKDEGTIGFLMPENLIFQQSYEGFRNFYLDGNKRLYFQRLVDWNKAGKPFAPVGHRFLGFFISKPVCDYSQGVPVIQFEKKPNNKRENIFPLKNYAHCQRFSDMAHIFDRTDTLAVTTGTSTTFSYATSIDEGRAFALVAGECPYKGREGVEVFPQELFLLTVSKTKGKNAYVSNYQSDRSKHKVAAGNFLIETDMLYPLVKGTDIERFHVESSPYVVPFPYDDCARSPIESERLTTLAPNLMRYFNANRSSFDEQTTYNDKIIGKKHKNEFYALARVGLYSYGNYFVAFRDNTKWQAAVVSKLPVSWSDESKRPVFQNHAVSISQRADGEFITEDEAHYICAIFNAPVVAQFILKSSDSRTFKIRPPVNVPPFDPKDKCHRKLVALSKKAHIDYAKPELMSQIDKELDQAYLALLKTPSVVPAATKAKQKGDAGK